MSYGLLAVLPYLLVNESRIRNIEEKLYGIEYKLKQPYPFTIVYSEGKYAVAVDFKTKEEIARSTDHVDVLQHALEKADRRVVALGEFEFSKTLYIKGGKELDMMWSRIIPKADVDLFYIEKNAKLRRVYVDLTQITTFTKAVVKLHGEQNFGTTTNTKVEGIRIKSDGKGIGIHFIVENPNESIGWVTVEDVETESLEHVIKLTALNDEPTAWINGNMFIDIRDYNSKYTIYIERNSSLSLIESAVNNNMFIGVRVQWGSNTETPWVIRGRGNIIIGKIWDVPSGATSVRLESDSAGTLIVASGVKDTITDNGINNKVLIQGDDTFESMLLGLSPSKNTWILDIPILIKKSLYIEDIIERRFTGTPEDGAWGFVIRSLSEDYPRFRLGTTGTISYSDGQNPLNIVLQNVGGKLRIQNVESLQIPTLYDCADLPSSGNFEGDARVCYDTGASKWVLKVWDGSNWQTIG